MKKGLLSILALAVTIVGCQNYDDQFDALNTQITALKSQVDGLAAVQNAVTALQGQLSALSSAALTNADLDAALSAGLADIIADVEAVQAAVADVATSAEVDAVNDALTDAQEDLDELLTSSNVYNDDVIVNSEATLTWAQGLGQKLTIVNGSVLIDVNADMDLTIVQEVVNNVGTVTGQFSYYASSSTIDAVTFDEILGADVIEIAQTGAISMAKLETATTINLGNNYQNSVTGVSFPALTSVSAFQTGQVVDNGGTSADAYLTVSSTTNGISFSKAETVDVSALPRYNSSVFAITMKKGGTLNMSALTSTNSDNEVVGRELRINGPSSLTFTNYKDGEIDLTNVETASIDGFYGRIDINEGVENLTINDGVVIDITGATDLTNATIDGKLDWDPERTTAATFKADAQNLDFASSDLEILTLSGDLGDITLDSEGNLTNLTISGKIKDLTLDTLGDLVSVNVTGATITDVTVNNCDDLGDVTFNHTFGNGGVTTDKAATVAITNNDNLGNVNWSADLVNSLTITGNSDLATINFTDLANIGETTASADIQNNDFTASSATDSWGDADGDDNDTDAGEGEGTEEGTATDAGTYVTDSGLGTLKTWLGKAVAAPAAGGVKVALDDVEVYISEADTTANNTEVNNPASSATDFVNIHWVVYVTADIPDTTPTIRETFSYAVELRENALYVTEDLIAGEALNVDAGTIDVDFAYTASTLDSVDELIAAINAETSFGSGVAVSAAKDVIRRAYYDVDMIAGGTATSTAAALATDTFAWSFGATTGTHTLSVAYAAGLTATNLASEIAGAIDGAVVSGQAYDASAASGIVTVSRRITNTTNTDDGVLTATFPSFAITTADTTNTTVDFNSGTGTNASVGTSGTNSVTLVYNKYHANGLRVTIKNNSTIVSLDGTTGITVTDGAAGTGAFAGTATSTLVSGTNMTGNSAYQAAFADVSTTGAATDGEDTNRLSWLSSGS